ncbi:MAG: hypothetical protein WBA22_03680 [Candidatus Methanofastidiosia archaeon]
MGSGVHQVWKPKILMLQGRLNSNYPPSFKRIYRESDVEGVPSYSMLISNCRYIKEKEKSEQENKKKGLNS